MLTAVRRVLAFGCALCGVGLATPSLVFAQAAPPATRPTTRPAVAAADAEAVPPKVRDAIDRGLEWLKANQQPDGSWAGGKGVTTAGTALAVMAFVARGHTPGEGPYGETIDRGIDYVLRSRRKDGLLSAAPYGNTAMYEHGISMLMLAEVRAKTSGERQARIDKALAAGVKLLLAAQEEKKEAGHQGGWRYSQTSRDSDISVTGWQLSALRAAADCGVEVPKASLDAGREFVRRCAEPREGGFTYQAGRGVANASRTGIGVFALEAFGERGSKEATAGGDYLLEHPFATPGDIGYFYYSAYYVALAYDRLGGNYWDAGYPKLRDAVLAAQGEKGSWPKGVGQEADAGETYRTSMAVLALCVPYHRRPGDKR